MFDSKHVSFNPPTLWRVNRWRTNWTVDCHNIYGVFNWDDWDGPIQSVRESVVQHLFRSPHLDDYGLLLLRHQACVWWAGIGSALRPREGQGWLQKHQMTALLYLEPNTCLSSRRCILGLSTDHWDRVNRLISNSFLYTYCGGYLGKNSDENIMMSTPTGKKITQWSI